MQNLDEKKAIEIFQKKLGIRRASDDVEQFRVAKDCIVKVDTLVESTDVPPKSPLLFAGKKSIVGPISDFAAKGVSPQYGIISVNIPRKFTKKQVEDVATGIAAGAKEYGIEILGGDTNEGRELVINVCIFGSGNKIPKRSGAKAGDSVFVTGPFGYCASGLEILLKKRKSSQNFAKIAKMAVLEPHAKVWFGTRAAKYFSSSMDSSDGLSATLNELARQGRCRIAVKESPVNQDVLEFAGKNKLDWKNLVFHGGEEYEIVFTARQRDIDTIKRIARSTHTPIFEIGTVEKGRGVFLQKGKETEKIPDRGWSHLG